MISNPHLRQMVALSHSIAAREKAGKDVKPVARVFFQACRALLAPSSGAKPKHG